LDDAAPGYLLQERQGGFPNDIKAMLGNIILLSSVSALVSFTVTETDIFLPMREWAKKKSTFFGKMLKCGYCFGFYSSLGLELIYMPNIFDYFVGYILTWWLIAWLSGAQWAIMNYLFKIADK
jgi:hypothetical protein